MFSISHSPLSEIVYAIDKGDSLLIFLPGSSDGVAGVWVAVAEKEGALDPQLVSLREIENREIVSAFFEFSNDEGAYTKLHFEGNVYPLRKQATFNFRRSADLSRGPLGVVTVRAGLFTYTTTAGDVLATMGPPNAPFANARKSFELQALLTPPAGRAGKPYDLLKPPSGSGFAMVALGPTPMRANMALGLTPEAELNSCLRKNALVVSRATIDAISKLSDAERIQRLTEAMRNKSGSAGLNDSITLEVTAEKVVAFDPRALKLVTISYLSTAAETNRTICVRDDLPLS